MPQPAADPATSLAKAIADKTSVSIIANEGSAPRPIDGQFIGPARPGDAGAIWLQPSPRALATVKSWALTHARISVRFNVGGIGAGIETTVAKHIMDYWLNERLAIAAMLVNEPTKIWLEQRSTPRYQMRNDGGGLRAKLIRRDPPGPARPVPGPESRATLWDLGLGGASFICPFGRLLTPEGASYEVTLHFAGKQALFPVRIAYSRTQGNLLRIGVEFNRAAATPESNQFLIDVVADLAERAERLDRRSA